jgi:hypothetical protein
VWHGLHNRLVGARLAQEVGYVHPGRRDRAVFVIHVVRSEACGVRSYRLSIARALLCMGRLYSGSWRVWRCVVSLNVYTPWRTPHRRRLALIGVGGRLSTNLWKMSGRSSSTRSSRSAGQGVLPVWLSTALLYSPPAAVLTLSSAWPRRGFAACSMRRFWFCQCVVRYYDHCRTTNFAQTYHRLPCGFRGRDQAPFSSSSHQRAICSMGRSRCR